MKAFLMFSGAAFWSLVFILVSAVLFDVLRLGRK